MAKIDKILDKTVRKDEEAKKWIVVVGIVVGVLIAAGLFLSGLFVMEPIIDEYTDTQKQIPALYSFYDAMKCKSNNNTIFFVGSSAIGLSVYPPTINKMLSDKGYEINTYNIVVDGDQTLERSLQIQNIIDCHPICVIYGVTYRTVVSDGIRDEDIMLADNKFILRDDSTYLYTDEQLDIINKKYNIYDKKRFLKNTMLWIFGSKTPYTLDYYNDPYGETHKKSRHIYTIDEILAEATDESNGWRPIVTNETTQSVKALLYNVKTLEDNGIRVIIINLPLHPLVSEKITNESRSNYHNVLNETGVTWFDWEHNYDNSSKWWFFGDSHHATWNGSQDFSEKMANLIIEQVENDVIHYT